MHHQALSTTSRYFLLRFHFCYGVDLKVQRVGFRGMILAEIEYNITNMFSVVCNRLKIRIIMFLLP